MNSLSSSSRFEESSAPGEEVYIFQPPGTSMDYGAGIELLEVTSFPWVAALRLSFRQVTSDRQPPMGPQASRARQLMDNQPLPTAGTTSRVCLESRKLGFLPSPQVTEPEGRAQCLPQASKPPPVSSI